MLIALGIILGILVLVGLYFMIVYNKLVSGKNMVEEAWSGINVQLKRRHDLIPALVNTVKGYMSHENDVLSKVAEFRSMAMSAPAGSIKDVMQAENQLTGALRSLFAVSENYPELKANANFMELQKTLAGIEDEIQMSRRYYNGTARAQNDLVLQFPSNIVANMFSFGKIEYFELDNEAERIMPAVSF